MHLTTLVIVITFSFWVRVTLVVVEVLEDAANLVIRVKLVALVERLWHFHDVELLWTVLGEDFKHVARATSDDHAMHTNQKIQLSQEARSLTCIWLRWLGG